MKHTAFMPKQRVELIAKIGSTPTQAIHEAIEFVKANDLEYADLNYRGFTFGIDHESNISELIKDYRYWKQYKNQKELQPQN